MKTTRHEIARIATEDGSIRIDVEEIRDVLCDLQITMTNSRGVETKVWLTEGRIMVIAPNGINHLVDLEEAE